MSMIVRAHVLISGIVQGVGFRYFVYERAVNLKISGFVKNLLTGQVELEAEGDRSYVEAFLREVKVGPRSSHITGVDIQWIKCIHSSSGFEIR